jgi:hypothetical protein
MSRVSVVFVVVWIWGWKSTINKFQCGLSRVLILRGTSFRRFYESTKLTFAGVTRGRHLERILFSTETTRTTLLVGNERRSLEAGIYKVKPA